MTPRIETLETFAKIADTDNGRDQEGHDARTLSRFRRLLNRAKPGDAKLSMLMATAMAHRKRKPKDR
jgi:hypothetical protein